MHRTWSGSPVHSPRIWRRPSSPPTATPACAVSPGSLGCWWCRTPPSSTSPGIGPTGAWARRAPPSAGVLPAYRPRRLHRRHPPGPFGLHTWRRRPEDTRHRRPPEERESRRWRAMLRASTAGLPPGTRAVTVADREADCIDFLQAALAEGQHVLLHAHHDRLLADRDARLREAAASAPVVGTFALRVPRQHERPERTAHVDLRVARVELPSPCGREDLPPVPVPVPVPRVRPTPGRTRHRLAPAYHTPRRHHRRRPPLHPVVHLPLAHRALPLYPFFCFGRWLR